MPFHSSCKKLDRDAGQLLSTLECKHDSLHLLSPSAVVAWRGSATWCDAGREGAQTSASSTIAPWKAEIHLHQWRLGATCVPRFIRDAPCSLDRVIGREPALFAPTSPADHFCLVSQYRFSLPPLVRTTRSRFWPRSRRISAMYKSRFFASLLIQMKAIPFPRREVPLEPASHLLWFRPQR